MYKRQDLKGSDTFLGSVAKCSEKSKGKDTTTGHWEIAGLILDKPFPVYPEGFPDDLIREFEKRAGKMCIRDSRNTFKGIRDSAMLEDVYKRQRLSS